MKIYKRFGIVCIPPDPQFFLEGKEEFWYRLRQAIGGDWVWDRWKNMYSISIFIKNHKMMECSDLDVLVTTGIPFAVHLQTLQDDYGDVIKEEE